MGGTFVVTLREGFEAALILGIVYTYLSKIGGQRHYRYVTVGGLLGVLASIVLGIAVSVLSGPLLDLGPDLIGLGVIFVAVFVLTWHGYWMRQQARALKGEIQRRIDEAESTHRLWVLGIIAFTGVFREGAETVLFIWGLFTQASSLSSWGAAAGAVLGLAMAAALGWTIFRGSRNVSLPRFFAATSGLLLFLAAGMFSTGVGKLEAFGFLPASPTLWDTSFVLDDRGLVGGFLFGLIGYRARPSVLEAAAYGAYLVIAGWALFGGAGSKRATQSQDRVPEQVA